MVLVGLWLLRLPWPQVRLMGGKIELVTHIGVGTTFFFMCPLGCPRSCWRKRCRERKCRMTTMTLYWSFKAREPSWLMACLFAAWLGFSSFETLFSDIWGFSEENSGCSLNKMCLVLRFLSVLLMGLQLCAPNIAVSVSSCIFGIWLWW